ncbi:MAG: RidA family protein [Pseudomonadales bacterium]|nr:RidA family protein [Pseudomonadales bacterium]
MLRHLIATLILFTSTGLHAAELIHHNSEALEPLNFPFSEAVQVGDTLYLAGQLGNVPGTPNLVPGGVEAQTRQTLTNIQATLERFGSDLQHVAKCTLFLQDIKDWPAVNKVYQEFFSKPFPARSALAASGLALGAAVEIECIAVVK